MKFLRLLLFVFLALTRPLFAQRPSNTGPRIFFSDLESGPNVGGQKNLGVWVTIWGKGFGAERGASTVTIGGGAAAEYAIWSDTKITFQLGRAAKTGDIVVTVREKTARAGAGQSVVITSNRTGQANVGTNSGGEKTSSNGLPFTVRPGKIY